MKKILKSRIFLVIITAIICTSIGVSATILYQADEIGFTPDDPNWNVNNLEDALNDLYENKEDSSDILWVNPSPTSEFTSKSISLDLSAYNAILVVGNYTNNEIYRAYKYTGYTIIDKNSTGNLKILYSGNDCSTRSITVSNNSVMFGNGGNEAEGNTIMNGHSIPIYIIGLRG